MPAETRHWTVEEVREMQDESRPWPRYELIGGELLLVEFFDRVWTDYRETLGK